MSKKEMVIIKFKNFHMQYFLWEYFNKNYRSIDGYELIKRLANCPILRKIMLKILSETRK